MRKNYTVEIMNKVEYDRMVSGNMGTYYRKSITVNASNEDMAMEIAESLNPGYCAVDAYECED